MKKFRLPRVSWTPSFWIETIDKVFGNPWILCHIGSKEFYLSYDVSENDRVRLRKFLRHAPHKEWKNFTLWWKTPPVAFPAPRVRLHETPNKCSYHDFMLGVAMIKAKRKAADALHEERKAGL